MLPVLIENTPGAMTTSERLRIFREQTHLDLHYCFDVANAHMTESIEVAFDAMKDRIRSTHIHDSDGKSASHLFPLLNGTGGTIDWAATMKLLATRAGQYPLVLELNEVADMQNPLEAAVTVFEKLTELSMVTSEVEE